jgi:hypothetical protein
MRIVASLCHHATYMKATDRDDRPYLVIAHQMEQSRKVPAREEVAHCAERRLVKR